MCFSEEGFGLFPAEAGVGDREAAFERFWIGMGLVAFMKIALHHPSNDRDTPFDLLKN